MAVLSDIDLKRILNNDEGIIILRRREKSITGLGYDLTIGFIRDAVTGETPAAFIDEDNVVRYTLLAGHRYLVISKEFLYLSPQYMATLHSRGSYALKGIIVTSTTVDPNYAGCITGSLFNCSPDDIHIKKENQFATMVFHKLCTPTNSFLQINERGNPMDTQETFHGRYPNIHSDACDAGDAYYGHVRKTVEPEFLDALKRMYQKIKLNTETVKETQASEEETCSKEMPPKKDSEDSAQEMNKKTPLYDEKDSSKEAPPKKDSEDSVQENQNIIKITFLIGNGFDLNVGLKTSYNHFYPYYIEEHPDDMLAKLIDEDIDKWSDLELALGQSTAEITSEEKNSFWTSEANLENSLAKYLRTEMKRIHLEDPEDKTRIAIEVCRSLLDFYKKPNGSYIESIQELLGSGINHREYSFITFNFTDTLEQCLNTLDKRSSLFDSFHISSYQGEKALHVHGNLGDGSIVLGVNDENQIANPNFRDDISKMQFIKSYINKKYKNTRKEDAEAVIKESNIICIFGMSLGKTDQTWWQELTNWLQEDASRKLVIFSKEDSDLTVNKWIMQKEMEIRDKFFNNVNISADVRKRIEEKEQIHVTINADLFHFKLV